MDNSEILSHMIFDKRANSNEKEHAIKTEQRTRKVGIKIKITIKNNSVGDLEDSVEEISQAV